MGATVREQGAKKRSRKQEGSIVYGSNTGERRKDNKEKSEDNRRNRKKNRTKVGSC